MGFNPYQSHEDKGDSELVNHLSKANQCIYLNYCIESSCLILTKSNSFSFFIKLIKEINELSMLFNKN